MDFEKQLRSVLERLSGEQPRSFGCDCCERIRSSFREPILEELISLGRLRIVRKIELNEFNLLRTKSSAVYDSVYPGYGDPSAFALAVSACGEVAFTDSPLDAAMNSSEFAAEAVAKKATLGARGSDYDSVYEAAYSSERLHQTSLLCRYVADSES